LLPNEIIAATLNESDMFPKATATTGTQDFFYVEGSPGPSVLQQQDPALLKSMQKCLDDAGANTS